jgi:hypothetical protein
VNSVRQRIIVDRAGGPPMSLSIGRFPPVCW